MNSSDELDKARWQCMLLVGFYFGVAEVRQFIKETILALLIIPYIAALSVLFVIAAIVFLPVVLLVEYLNEQTTTN